MTLQPLCRVKPAIRACFRNCLLSLLEKAPFIGPVSSRFWSYCPSQRTPHSPISRACRGRTLSTVFCRMRSRYADDASSSPKESTHLQFSPHFFLPFLGGGRRAFSG